MRGDLVLDVPGQRRPRDARPELRGHPRDRVTVTGSQLPDLAADAAVRVEFSQCLLERGHGHHETGRHGYPSMEQLAQAGRLAAHDTPVASAELAKFPHHAHLSAPGTGSLN